MDPRTLGCLVLFALAAAPAAAAREAVVDAVSVEVSVDPTTRRFSGTETLTVRAPSGGADALALDAAGLSVSGLRRRARAPSLWELGRELTGGATVQVRVDFTGGADAGLAFVDGTAWSRGADEGGGRWFPAPAGRVAFSAAVTVPDGLTAVSNGRLLTREAGARPGTTRFSWAQTGRMPASLAALYAGRYAAVVVSTGPIAVTAFVPPGREDAARAAFAPAAAMLARFAADFGAPYAWDGLTLTTVRHPLDDGLENAGAPRFDESALDGDSEELVAHELVHQWLGAWITPRAPRDAWLFESFASWYASRWLGASRGADEGAWSLDEKARAVFTGEARAPHALAVPPLDAQVYGRGAWFLQILRGELGPDAFDAAVRRMVARRGGGAAEADDLRVEVDSASAKSYGGYFGLWPRLTSHPRARMTLSYDDRSHLLSLDYAQIVIPSTATSFVIVVPLRTDAGDSFRLTSGGLFKKEDWPTIVRPRWVEVDPAQTGLYEFEREWPEDMLVAEVSRAPSAVSRARAARELADAPSPEAEAALADCLRREPFWGVAASCAYALGVRADDGALAALNDGARRPDARVRRAAAAALGRFRGRGDGAETALKSLLADADRAVAAEAARALARRDPAYARTLWSARLKSAVTDAERFDAWEVLAALGDGAARRELEKAAKDSRDAWRRRAGGRALEGLIPRR
jgi:aminopeptidase N